MENTPTPPQKPATPKINVRQVAVAPQPKKPSLARVAVQIALWLGAALAMGSLFILFYLKQ